MEICRIRGSAKGVRREEIDVVHVLAVGGRRARLMLGHRVHQRVARARVLDEETPHARREWPYEALGQASDHQGGEDGSAAEDLKLEEEGVGVAHVRVALAIELASEEELRVRVRVKGEGEG